jgi:uncharacterized protein YcbX
VQDRELNIYPIKSSRAVSLDSADVEPWGLAGDRRWMDGKTWFGVNAIPDSTGTIRLGDRVEVLDAHEPAGVSS